MSLLQAAATICAGLVGPVAGGGISDAERKRIVDLSVDLALEIERRCHLIDPAKLAAKCYPRFHNHCPPSKAGGDEGSQSEVENNAHPPDEGEGAAVEQGEQSTSEG